MLLITLDIDGTIRRVSNEELVLEHSWYAEVSSEPYIKYATAKIYGGMAAPSFGGFSLLPTTFEETTWPPPSTIGVKIEWTETDEGEAITLMQGTGYRLSLTQDTVAYNLLKEDYNATVKTNITGTLSSVFTTYCGVSYLNRTLDTTGTSRDPAVSYNVTTTTSVATVLSNIAAFFSHGFYDDGTTIYLYDCLTANGSKTLTEFDIEQAAYKNNNAVSSFIAGDYSVTGSNQLGTDMNITPVCHTSQTNIEEALADIKTLVEKPVATIPIVIAPDMLDIKPGMNITLSDESCGINSSIMVQSMYWDFANYSLKIEGGGTLT